MEAVTANKRGAAHHRIGKRTDLPHQFESVHQRHFDVGKDQVRTVVSNQLQRLASIPGFEKGKPLSVQIKPEQFAIGLHIVGDQNQGRPGKHEIANGW